jgi:hypothetical protein
VTDLQRLGQRRVAEAQVVRDGSPPRSWVVMPSTSRPHTSNSSSVSRGALPDAPAGRGTTGAGSASGPAVPG